MAVQIKHVTCTCARPFSTLLLCYRLFQKKLSNTGMSSGFTRCSSSLVKVQLQDEVATLELNRRPVNSFSLEFLEEINTTLSDIENNRDIRGLILTSGLPKVFSAGLDLVKEVHNPNAKRLGVFWRAFQEMWLQLYGSRLATIAVINGHAVAGGCVLATACDFRFMAPNYTIGLNETAAGIAVPSWVLQGLINLIGRRTGENAVLLGLMFSSNDALSNGLVDKVVDQKSLLIEARQQMEQCLAIPESARAVTKHTVRREMLQKMRDNREEDLKDFVNYIMRESTQKYVKIQIDKIKQRRT